MRDACTSSKNVLFISQSRQGCSHENKDVLTSFCDEQLKENVKKMKVNEAGRTEISVMQKIVSISQLNFQQHAAAYEAPWLISKISTSV